MTATRKSGPSWGAFRGIKPKADETSVDLLNHGNGSHDAVNISETVVDLSAGESRHFENTPAFDVRSVRSSSDIGFYAVPSDDPDEDEYENLGEGALRQIVRNFVSLAGTCSAVALLGAVVFWAVPNGRTEVAMIADAGEIVGVEEAGDVSVLQTNASEISNDAVATLVGNDISVDQEPKVKTIEISVDLPIPSVVAVADAGISPLKSTLMETSEMPGPMPTPRAIAMAALEEFEDGPLAQGSDDEAISAGRSLLKDKEAVVAKWVSVMIPKSRPLF